MELTDFELKKKNFFEKHNINPKKNRKTNKWNFTKNLYVDAEQEFQLGKIPPLTHHYTNPDTEKITEVKVCKFCWNPLPEIKEKEHDRIFCDSKNDCPNLYWKIRNLVTEKKKKEADIIGINWEPEKIKNEFWDKAGKIYPPQYKIPERIIMKIIREGKPDKEDWEPLTTRKRTPKKDV